MQILQMPIQSPIFNVQAKFANSSPTSGCREQGVENGVQLSTVGISSITMAYPRPGSRPRPCLRAALCSASIRTTFRDGGTPHGARRPSPLP